MIGQISVTLGVALVAALLFSSVVFAIGHARHRYDVADVIWGLLFILIAWVGLVVGKAPGGRPVVVTALVTIWGLRLAYSISRRFNSHAEEDKRYTAMREGFRAHPVLKPYLKIFAGQAALALVVSLPVSIVATTSSAPINLLDFAGIMVWIVGFYFEAVGDAQLKKFLTNPANKGTLMTAGLWRYTRHPNYFGEVTQWWGIGIIALSVPFGWLGLIGPALITFLIVKVSGVPPLERHYGDRPDWQAYKRVTSMLIPLPPKH